jgi:putative transposase
MSVSGYQIRNQHAVHFLTFTICGWVDVFTRKETKQIVIDSFKYCIEKKGLILYAYVIMSNHVHIIAKADEATSGLSDIVRDFKKFTASKLIDWMNNSGKESRKDYEHR